MVANEAKWNIVHFGLATVEAEKEEKLESLRLNGGRELGKCTKMLSLNFSKVPADLL